MATNTASLKTFAQETRKKLISLITTKMRYVLTTDTAELRAYASQIAKLRKQVQERTEKIVVEEVAYTWFNRMMALRFMDANGYNAPMIVTPAAGQTRPEILQDAMGGSIDDSLMLTAEERILPEAKLYRKLLVTVCNKQMSQPMPFLFEHLTTYTELLLPDDLLSDQSFVSDIRRGMTDEDCQNVELMGWLYQFYITDRKADAETKKSKKGGLKSDEQAAATQLFTPHWIVRYMVENSLGRIWMTLHPDSHLVEAMPYYIPTPEGQTDTIPKDIHSAKDIRFLDPCMGSGHILVYAFDLFTKMYEEEGEQAKDIPTLILENNLFGIDIDRRCYQLAAFALTMKARANYRRYLRHTVMPNVISLEKIDHDTIDSAGAWGQKSLMWQFENIDTIGSLLKITPEECASIRVEENSLFGKRQRLLKTQAEYLSRKYHCVVTNPPYLGKGFGPALKAYIEKQFPLTKYDTMATFMERCILFSNSYSKVAMINMHAWMFISSYDKLRKILLSTYNIDSMLHLGTRAFEEISGEVVQSTAFVLSNHEPTCSVYYRLVDGDSSTKEQAFLAKDNEYFIPTQSIFNKIPGSPVGYWISNAWYKLFDNQSVIDYVISKAGVVTGNDSYFVRIWFEPNLNDFALEGTGFGNYAKYHSFQKGGSPRRYYGNYEYVIKLNDFWNEQFYNVSIRRGDKEAYFKKAIGWSQVGNYSLKTFRYINNSVCGTATPTLYCKEDKYYNYLLGFINTNIAPILLNLFNPTINLLTTDVGNLPFIYCEDKVDEINRYVLTNIAISKQDWDAHETSWDFLRNPLWEQQLYTILFEMQDRGVLSENATIDDIGPFNLPDLLQPIEILVENYKSEWEDHFHTLHHNEEELNRKFIEIYGLQDELTPDVPLDEITILQKGEISIKDNKIDWHDDVIIKQLISYLVGCLMGRYSVDKPGLIIASQGQKVTDLDLPAHTIEIDDDGIIPVIMEEDFFADDLTQRIETAVKKLFGERYFYENIKFIKSALGMNLRDYIYKNYYADHQQMYSVKGAKRPIYWLFSSQMGEKKKKGHFKALVYMHRLESDTLSRLHADYVHPYLTKVEQQLCEAEDNATRDDLSQAQHNKALKLAEELKEKVREVKAFETQLVEMASARITIDLDDGVKTNYPKFYPLVEPIKGLDTKDE